MCPPALYGMLCRPNEARFSVNLINHGLEWHRDFNDPKEEDVTLTIPGMTFVVHLCTDSEDIVSLEVDDKVWPVKPMMAYVFPGYAFKHRTARPVIPQKTSPKRYSVAIFTTFRKEDSQLADAYIHDWFPQANDNYKGRTKQIQDCCDRYVKRAQRVQSQNRIKRSWVDKNQKAPDLSIDQPYAHIEQLVTVAKSTVHGTGLFAKQNLPKGSVICWYSGTCTRHLDNNNRSGFILDVEWLNPKTNKKEVWYLDSIDKNNSAGRWANDARFTKFKNNAEYMNGPFAPHPLAKGKYYIFVRAKRHIWKGEEILVDYGDSYWSKHGIAS